MGTFHHPPAGLRTGQVFFSVGFLTARPDMGCETGLSNARANRRIVIALVHAHALGRSLSRLRAIHGNAVNRVLHQPHIGTIRAADDHAHRNPMGFRQHAAFHSGFGPIRGIRPGFSPRPRGLWSWPRPYSTTSSPALGFHQTVLIRLATVSQTPPLAPIPETGCARLNPSSCRSHPKPSIDTLCAARRKFHRHTSDREPVACRLQTDAYSRAPVSMGPIPPTTPLKLDTARSFCSPVPCCASCFPSL